MTVVERDSYATAELHYIGMPTSINNVRSFVIWMAAENTKAEWNPHATTEPAEGATDFNSAGVKNYPNITVGLEAFKQTIENGLYDSILGCLARNAPPAETCAAIVNSAWGSKPTPTLVAEVLTNWVDYATVIISGSEEPTPVPTPEPTPQPTEDDVQVPTLSVTADLTPRLPVKTVQLILNDQAGARLTVDGLFGELTEGAVKAWQTFWHITVDGIVGPETWSTLINL